MSTSNRLPEQSIENTSDSKEPLLFRLQLLFRPGQQIAVALVIVAILAGMFFYLGYKSYLNQGLIEIDRSERRTIQYMVDLNSSEWPEFANLPGIGEKLAKTIVEFREINGPFRFHGQLDEVPGIGPAKLASLKPYLAPIPNPASE